MNITNVSSLPIAITRDYDTEKLIKYNALSPSLQARIKKLEDAANKMVNSYTKTHNDIRMTFANFPPSSPQESKEFWIDTKYRVLRVYAEGNWEFTRAAWYKGTGANPSAPITSDPSIPAIDIHGQPVSHSLTYMTYSSGSGNVSRPVDANYFINGTVTGFTIQSAGNIDCPAGRDAVVGYILMVIYNNKIEDGTAYAWPITKTRENQIILLDKNNAPINLSANAFARGKQFVVEIDTNDHRSQYITPVSFDPKIDADKYSGTVYFGNTSFPYCISRAEADTAIAAGSYPNKTRNYASYSGTFTISVSCTYLS